LNEISGKYAIVWGYVNNAWKKYQPGKPSDLTTFEPGYGYWIKTNTVGAVKTIAKCEMRIAKRERGERQSARLLGQSGQEPLESSTP